GGGNSFLESFRPRGMRLGSRITAAATTGPASGPRPASSHPAIGQMPRLSAARSRRKVGRMSSSASGRRGARFSAMRLMGAILRGTAGKSIVEREFFEQRGEKLRGKQQATVGGEGKDRSRDNLRRMSVRIGE